MRRYSAGEEAVAGYRLLHFIGRGQFGEVWRAAAPGGVEVALKIIDLHGTVGLRELAGFQCIKRLHHPNLISVNAAWLKTEAGVVLSDWPEPMAEMAFATSTKRFVGEMARQKDLPNLAELIVAMGLGSNSLHERLQECLRRDQKGVPAAELIALMRQAAAALDYLNKPIHDFGHGPLPLIHGDIKPQNLLIVGDMLQVCDFGLVRALETLRRKATVMGTYAYAAPELLDGAPHRASDQYCLAVSYVECRTGSLPFDASEGVAQVIERHRTGALDLSQLPAGEEAIVRRATSPQPADRFASCAQFVEGLAQACQAEPSGLGETSANAGNLRRTIGAPMGATELSGGEKTDAHRPRAEAAAPSSRPCGPAADLGRTAVPWRLDLPGAADEHRPTVFDQHAASAFTQTPVAGDTTPPGISKPEVPRQRRRSRVAGAALTAALILAVVAGGLVAYSRWRPSRQSPDTQATAELARAEPPSEQPVPPSAAPAEKPSTMPVAAKRESAPPVVITPVITPAPSVTTPAKPATTIPTAPAPAKPPLQVASLNPPPPKLRPNPPQRVKVDPLAGDCDRGKRALIGGDNDGAIDAFSKVLAVDASHIEALRGRGRAYQLRNQPGDLKRAVADLELAVDKRPADFEALEWLADADADLARSDPSGVDKKLAGKAIATYTRAHALAPERIAVLTSRGIAHLLLDQFDEALRDADLATAVNGRHAPIDNLRGQVYDKQHQYGLAIEAFGKAIDIDPANYRYWGNRGLCRYNAFAFGPPLPNEKPLETMRLAREDCQKMIALPPPHPPPSGYSRQLADAWMVVGFDFFYTDKLQDAINAFGKAIENNPSLAVAFYHRSLAYRRTGDQVRAKRDWDITLKIDPQFLERLKRPGSR